MPTSTGGDYYVNLFTGTIQQQHNALLAKALLVAGFVGPFNTIADAKAAYSAATGHAYGGVTGGPGGATGAGLPNPAAGVSSFLGAVSSANLWLRVAEVVTGLVLLAIGLNTLLKGTVAGDTAGAVLRTVKAVP